MNITGKDLAYACNKKSATRLMNELADALNHWLPHYRITHPKEIAYLIANMIPETGRFYAIVENLNYSESALIKTFSFYRNNPDLARKHAKKPKTIANTVYDDKNRGARYKLGNTSPGDGWKYRGAGPGQITGKSNFADFANKSGIDVVSNPELLHDPFTGIQAMCSFWVTNSGLGRTARAGKPAANRKIYNGGSHGLSMMRKYLPRCHKVSKRIGAEGSEDWKNLPDIKIQEKKPPKPRPPRLPKPVQTDAMSFESAPISMGMKGAHVEELQKMLNAKGYHVGRADGHFGKLTRNAVAKLKLENGMDTSDPTMPISLSEARTAKRHEDVRKDMKMSDLRESGSTEVKTGDLGQVATGAGGVAGTATAVVKGLPDEEPVSVEAQAEELLEKGEQAQSFFERVQGIFSGIGDGAVSNVEAIGMIIIACAVAFWLFQRMKNRRLAASRELRNI